MNFQPFASYLFSQLRDIAATDFRFLVSALAELLICVLPHVSNLGKS